MVAYFLGQLIRLCKNFSFCGYTKCYHVNRFVIQLRSVFLLYFTNAFA